MNAHEERAYADLPRQRLPQSENAHDSVILLPLYNNMTRAEQRYVTDCLQSFVMEHVS
jgi:dTDP-4-amino-4,6-dideoxygalactose transaminase